MNPGQLAGLWPLVGLVPYAALSAVFIRRLGNLPRDMGPDPARAAVLKAYRARRAAAAVAGGLFWIATTLAASGVVDWTRYVPQRVRDAEAFVVLDVSNSMLVEEDGTSRLDAASRFALALAGAVPRSRWALVAFRGGAVMLCPPTYDLAAFEEAMRWAGPGVTSAAGSDAGAALAEALRGMEPGRARTVVFIGDGNDTGGSARERAVGAGEAGADCVFVGVGGETAVPVKDVAGMPVVDAAGSIVESALNAAALEDWARAAGGQYVGIDDPAAFSRVAAVLSGNQDAVGSWRNERVRVEATGILLGAALCFLAAGAWLALPPLRRRTR